MVFSLKSQTLRLSRVHVFVCHTYMFNVGRSSSFLTSHHPSPPANPLNLPLPFCRNARTVDVRSIPSRRAQHMDVLARGAKLLVTSSLFALKSPVSLPDPTTLASLSCSVPLPLLPVLSLWRHSCQLTLRPSHSLVFPTPAVMWMP